VSPKPPGAVRDVPMERRAPSAAGRKLILVTGAAGQLGSVMADALRPDHDVVALGRADLDIADHRAVMDRVLATRPDAIVNCAAYNRVDAAEADPVPALNVNAFAVRSLAQAATAAGATLVHYSTDFVFDGTASRPYAELDPANPKSAYAVSKLLGEWFALEAPRAYVLRVESLFGGSIGKSSVDRVADAIIGGVEARVFADRTVSPSYVVDVAAATRVLLDRNAPPGLYHCVNTGFCTWYELAAEIARLLGREKDARLLPVSVADVPLPAARPQFAALSNARLTALVPMPAWQDALGRYLQARRP
jgi:dTDP-4-dehydrorhamnose reductase